MNEDIKILCIQDLERFAKATLGKLPEDQREANQAQFDLLIEAAWTRPLEWFDDVQHGDGEPRARRIAAKLIPEIQ